MKLFIIFIVFTLGKTNFDIDLDGLNSERRWISIEGAPIGSYSGRTVCNIGDFNGDGIDDMVVTAPNSLSSEVVYVIYGQKDRYSKDFIAVNSTYSEGFAIKGPFIGGLFSGFGSSVSKAVDLNRDGLSDIVIGASGFSNSQGIVYVIYGKKGHKDDIIINKDLSFSSSQGFVIFGPQLSQLGSSVSSAGDFNGDGFDDLLIGAPAAENFMGAVYVIYGKKGGFSNIFLNETTLSSQQGLTIFGSEMNCRLGQSLEGVGDINGDGLDDIIFAAPQCFYVYGLYGKKKRSQNPITVDPQIDISQGFLISSSSLAGSLFGGSLSSAGDLNGDGIGDIIIGTFSLTRSTGAFVFYGRKENWPSFSIGNDLTPHQGFRITDSRSAMLSLGITVSGGGDTNGDGIDDILVRARNRTSGGGYIAVIYGTPMTLSDFDISSYFTSDKGFIISGSDLNLQAVQNSLSIGDFNNDNIDDIVVGAPQSGIYAGKTYIVFGSNGCPGNCSSCQSSRCLTCFEGYGLYQGVCGICPSATFLSKEGRCEECPDDCIQCKSSLKCQVCDDGYSLSSSQMCISESQEAQAAISSGLFDGASAISNALALGSSVPTNFGLVAKILRNTKYLNISVSKDLQATFNSWKISTGIFPAPDSGSSDSQGSLLPLVFERYEMKSAFLFNYWKSFMMIVVGLGCFIISKSAEIIFSKSNSVGKITRTVNVAASNFVLTQFYGSIDDVLFYSVIDVRSGEFTSSGFRTFGLILGLLLLLVGFGVTGLHGVILYKYQHLKKQGSEKNTAQVDFLLQFLKKYENIKLFYQDFKDIDVFQQAFLLINITRSIISSLIFTMLFRYPLLQILLLMVLNICILAYLLTKKPFKNSSNAYAQYFCEGVLLIAYLSILVLAFMDEAESEALSPIKGFSMVVIISNMALLVGSTAFMLVNIAVILYQIYQERKSKKDATIPTTHSRLDLSHKIEHNMRRENNNNMVLNDSGFNLVHPPMIPIDYFQKKTNSRKKILKGRFQRNLQPPMSLQAPINPLALTTQNAPVDLQVELSDSSFTWLSNQRTVNLESVQERRTTKNNRPLETSQYEPKIETTVVLVPLERDSVTVRDERKEGDGQFGPKKSRIKKIRR